VEQRERALKEKDRKIQEKEHALQEKQRQLALAIRSLHVAGTPVSQIAAAFALSEAEVEVEATLRELP
jgi:methylthioribose-1-phosphate isomerase